MTCKNNLDVMRQRHICLQPFFDGIVPLSSSLDTAGVLTRTVEDLAYAFAALDPEHAGQPAPAPARLQGLRVGVPTNHFWDNIDPSIAAVVDATIAQLVQAGAQVVCLPLPHCEEAFDIFRRGGFAASELAAYLDLNFPHKVERLDPVVRDRVRWAEQVSSVEYLQRKAVLARCGAGAVRVFDGVDVLLTPTVPASPPRLADIGTVESYASANMKAMRNTAISNLFGWCALTMPAGLDANRMPVGLQLMGPPRAEARLIGIALGIEALIGPGHALLGAPDLS